MESEGSAIGWGRLMDEAEETDGAIVLGSCCELAHEKASSDCREESR